MRGIPLQAIATFVSKNAPTILTALGATGVITTAVLAVKATPVALQMIEDFEGDNYDYDHEEPYEATLVEKVKVTWKLYLPSVLMGAATIACVIGGNSLHARRTAALASAYSLMERAATEYQRKVTEVVGEKRDREIREAVHKDRVDANPPSKETNLVMVSEDGDALFLEPLSGRYFKSSVAKVDRAINTLNHRLVNGVWLSVNELYSELGLDHTKLGDDLGWSTDNLLQIHYSAIVSEEGVPVVVLDFEVDPKFDPHW